MTDEMEMTAAYHCAPALAGIKPSNLVSFCMERHPDLEKRLAEWNEGLAPSGIFFEKLCRCKKRMLVLVYRKKKMEELLRDPKLSAELGKAGYPAGQDCEAVISHLKRRMEGREDFPHEIGIFLGYPLEDVYGFVQNQGKGYKLNGYWKVYSNEDRAKELFRRYTRCREAVCARMGMGMSIMRLFAVA